MDGKKTNKKDTNLILYPGLVKRLIEKGMDALKAKDATSAYEHFLTAEQYEPDHPQVRFGKVLSLVELGRLKEAVTHTSALLNEGIGDYYDNLQVHISLLVQLGHYQEVVDMLEAVLSENTVPAQFAESFYQLLHFSRQMIDDSVLLANIEEEVPEPSSPITELKSKLDEGSVKDQWKALQYLKERQFDDALEPLIMYIEDASKDWLLRSFALEILHMKQCEHSVHIKKAHRTISIIPNELEAVNNQPFAIKVRAELEKNLEHEDPLLAEMAEQIGNLHLFAWYPFTPEPDNTSFWAGVYHFLASERLGLDKSIEEIADLYEIDEDSIKEKAIDVTQLEESVFEAYTHFTQ
jgi:tetratricopeptide (TPR) repeat protein